MGEKTISTGLFQLTLKKLILKVYELGTKCDTRCRKCKMKTLHLMAKCISKKDTGAICQERTTRKCAKPETHAMHG